MKGLYLVKADHEMMERAIAAGIDTLLIPFYSYGEVPWDGTMDTFDQNVETCKRFKDKAVVIACPVVFPHWWIVPNGRKFVHNGVALPGHFCPTNGEHLEMQMAPFRALLYEGLIHEVIWDVEHYSGLPKYFSEKIPCECSFCSSLGWEGQWKHRAMMVHKDSFSTGQLAIDSKWSVACLNRKRVLVEGTYPKTGFMMRLQLWATKWWNNIDTLVPGAYIEVFRELDGFIQYLKYLSSHCPYSGYWIYSQMCLTRNLTMSPEEVQSLTGSFGYYDTRRVGERDFQFFEKLKIINGG